MSQNQLQYLPMHVSYGTVYLEIVNMSRNHLRDLPLHVFFGTVYLEILNMSQNKLQDLPLHVFYGTAYLEILNMSQNKNKLQYLPLRFGIRPSNDGLGTSATANMSVKQLRQLAIALRSLGFSEEADRPS